MDIVSKCAGKVEPAALAVMKTTMMWILGRELLKVAERDPENWTAVCVQIMTGIQAGVYEPTAEQQQALTSILGAEGSSYMAVVYDGITKNQQFPPGFVDTLCALSPPTFACFANRLAEAYDQDVADGGSRLAQALGAANWSANCEQGSQDLVYQPVAPYSVPQGLLEGGVWTPGTPAAKKTNWTPWIIGGVAVLAVGGGVAYAATRKPRSAKRSQLASANPRAKRPTWEEIDAEIERIAGNAAFASKIPQGGWRQVQIILTGLLGNEMFHLTGSFEDDVKRGRLDSFYIDDRVKMRKVSSSYAKDVTRGQVIRAVKELRKIV